jgi:hypothetical protein
LGDGDVISFARGGGPQYFKIFDFDVTTGQIGTEWTKHANMVQHTNATSQYYEHRADVERIPGSNFAFFWYDSVSTAWYPKTTTELYTFSLNKTTKVFGENVNVMTPTITGLSGVNVNPVHDVILVRSGQNIIPVKFERATGVIGIAGPAIYWDNSGNTPPVWEPSGLNVFGLMNNHNNRSSSTKRFSYDPITNAFTLMTYNAQTFLNVTGGNNYARDIKYTEDGNLLMYLDHNSYSQSLYFGILESTVGTILGSYTGGPVSKYTDFFPVGNVIVGFAMSDVAINAPLVFFERQSIAPAHIQFVNPPASGAVITADFHTKYIPKDINHILDLEIKYSFMGG